MTIIELIRMGTNKKRKVLSSESQVTIEDIIESLRNVRQQFGEIIKQVAKGKKKVAEK